MSRLDDLLMRQSELEDEIEAMQEDGDDDNKIAAKRVELAEVRDELKEF